MADCADVVPLPLGRGARGGPEFPEPADFFIDSVDSVDSADPARALTVTWSPDHEAVRVGIRSPEGSSAALVLDAAGVLELVRALVEGLPECGGRSARPPATVLPLERPARWAAEGQQPSSP